MLFHFIQYLLTGICIISTINIFLIYKLKSNTAFSSLLSFLNGFLILHALSVIGMEPFYGNQFWLSHYAPFSLMYGPFLYFAFPAITERKIGIQSIVLHSMLFFVFFIGFLYIIAFKESDAFRLLYYKVLSLITVISISSYTLLAMFLNLRPINDQFRQKKLMILGAIIILMFISIVTIVAVTSAKQFITKPNAILLLRIMVYGGMFMVTILIFKYKVNMIFLKINNAAELVKTDKINLKPTLYRPAKYKKSTLSSKQLDEYSKKLEKLMLSQKIYLATDLSLQKLAQLLRIPNHHLTQVLSLKIRMGFYDYVNGFRVQYACMLLEREPNMSLEDIALQSGFNSKISFNRHFKVVMGCTPSSYRTNNPVFK